MCELRAIFLLLCAAFSTSILAEGVSESVPSLGVLFGQGPAQWPGHLLLLDSGPPAIGAGARITLGDVTGDGLPDLLQASPYAEVICFPAHSSAKFGPPRLLLAAPGPILRDVEPAIAWLTTADGKAANLLLMLAGHLFAYPVHDGAIGQAHELLTSSGQPLLSVLRDCGIKAVTSIAAAGTRALFLCDDNGRIWRCGIAHRLTIGKIEPVRAANGQLQFRPPVTLCVLSTNGGSAAVAVFAADGLWLCEVSSAGLAKHHRIAWQIRDPDSLPVKVGSIDGIGGRLAFVASDGRVFSAAIGPEGLADEDWLAAEAAPLCVGGCAAPWPCDWDGDGDTDLVVGAFDGRLRLFLSNGAGRFKYAGLVRAREGPIRVGSSEPESPCFPALQDLDGDGDADLLVGGADGRLRIWRNEGYFTAAGEVPLPAVSRAGFCPVPTPLDWDGDGDIDLLVGLKPVKSNAGGKSFVGMLYLENQAGPGRWPDFFKAVAVDVMISQGEAMADGGYLQPCQPLLPQRLTIGALVPIACRYGIFPFRLATTGPAYPRFVISSAVARRPLHPRASAWSVVRASGRAVMVGLEPYGFVCEYHPAEE